MELIQTVVGNLPWWLILLFIAIIITKAWIGKPTHFRRIRQAKKIIKQLQAESDPAKQFYILRGVDAFVFEEMILTAIKNAGHSIRRNERYTGDGGVDGQAKINGRRVLIQAKRYRNHINPRHVEEFKALCSKKRCKGLFVHTGKTGKASWKAAAGDGVELISGQKLLDLICSRPISWE